MSLTFSRTAQTSSLPLQISIHLLVVPCFSAPGLTIQPFRNCSEGKGQRMFLLRKRVIFLYEETKKISRMQWLPWSFWRQKISNCENKENINILSLLIQNPGQRDSWQGDFKAPLPVLLKFSISNSIVIAAELLCNLRILLGPIFVGPKVAILKKAKNLLQYDLLYISSSPPKVL